MLLRRYRSVLQSRQSPPCRRRTGFSGGTGSYRSVPESPWAKPKPRVSGYELRTYLCRGKLDLGWVFVPHGVLAATKSRAIESLDARLLHPGHPKGGDWLLASGCPGRGPSLALVELVNHDEDVGE